MDQIKASENIKKEKQYNMRWVISIAIATFVILNVILVYIIIKHNSNVVIGLDFRFIINILLSIIGILSCLLAHNSNKKDELFIIALMYTMFFMDITNAKLTGYMITNEREYYAIITSLIRIGILYISVSNNNKLKSLIINNKTESLMITAFISILAIYIEYNYMIPYSSLLTSMYKYYSILFEIIYIIAALKFFNKSFKKNEYIYSVIGASILMFSIKGLYNFCYVIYKCEDISLTSDIITLISFIIFIVGIFIELNQNININKILDEQRNLFIKIIDENKHSSIIICDEDYKILYKNKRAIESLRHYDSCDKINIDLGGKLDIPIIFDGISDLNQVEKQLIKKGCYIKDVYEKETKDAVDLAIHLHEKYNMKYKVITIRDISEKYKLEKALLEYEAMKKEDAMKNEFFANISHELKTPLNIIYSTNQLLDISKDKNDFREIYTRYSSSVNINCKRMLRLIDNIVDIAKLEVGYKTPNFENYNIVEVIEDMTMSVINYAEEKEISIIFDTDEEELNIKCDLDMLERIILNLLSNAIKFSYKDSSIFVTILSDKDWVSIKVKDNGIGIEPELQSKIFDRFVQVDKSIRRRREGSGIGLSLVKTFVELMEGKVHIESDGKTGTEFTILLPNKTINSNTKSVEEENYNVDLNKVQQELSDIYELYESSYN